MQDAEDEAIRQQTLIDCPHSAAATRSPKEVRFEAARVRREAAAVKKAAVRRRRHTRIILNDIRDSHHDLTHTIGAYFCIPYEVTGIVSRVGGSGAFEVKPKKGNRNKMLVAEIKRQLEGAYHYCSHDHRKDDVFKRLCEFADACNVDYETECEYSDADEEGEEEEASLNAEFSASAPEVAC